VEVSVSPRINLPPPPPRSRGPLPSGAIFEFESVANLEEKFPSRGEIFPLKFPSPGKYSAAIFESKNGCQL